MSEIKPRSMRMSDENYMRLQGLSEGRSLDETITFLLSTHDKAEERNGLGNQAVKLDELDEFLNAIRSQFASLLHTCQNAREVVRTEYRRELEEKNLSIENQKDEILKLQRNQMRKDASSQEVIEQLRAQLEAEKKENASLESRIRELEKTAAQKQQVIDSLSAALSSAEKKAAKLEETEKLLSRSEAELKELRKLQMEWNEEQKLLQKKAKEAEINDQLQQKEAEKALEKCRVDAEEQIRKSRTDFEEQLAKCKADFEEQINRLKLTQEQELKAMRAESDFAVREAQLQAQAQINTIKEEYQNKMFELLLKDTEDRFHHNNEACAR